MWRLIFILMFLPAFAWAQGLQVGFQGLNANKNAPIEIAADSMTLNNATGQAELRGDVVVIQGDLRMQAQAIDIAYTQTGGLNTLKAWGGILLVTAAEEVEAQSATYDVVGERMLLVGDVLMVQGQSAISADRMDIDLATETAQFDGRVRTVLTSGDQ